LKLELNKYSKYIQENTLKSLHPQAFTKTINIIKNFIQQGNKILTTGNKDESKKLLAWVCNSRPGYGKTTALKAELKIISEQKRKTPLLLVFNNKDTMENVYGDVRDFGKNNGNQNLILRIDAGNYKEVQHTLNEFQFLCITQQRLRDIVLDKKYSLYSTYQPKEIGNFDKVVYKRQVIIDEMPILSDSAVFDLSSNNNSVDWFDKLAKLSSLTPVEKRLCRNCIMLMITHALFSKVRVTKNLMQYINNVELEIPFKVAMGKLSESASDLESSRKLRWFKKLLNEDGIGHVDRNDSGEAILCSKLIDYRCLGNVLILDGTSSYAKTIYKGYKSKNVSNYHNYSRLNLHWHNINTSLGARIRLGLGVQKAISIDVANIRETKGINPFPLVAKQDIDTYISNGLIAEEFKEYYKLRSLEDDEMPLNLFNTTGKNNLRNYNEMVMTNIPIKNAQHYKLLAISIYGVDIDTSLSEKGKRGWFKNIKVEKIYQESVLVELLQIIHRTGLRNIKDTKDVHIYMYGNREYWVKKIASSLGIPEENIFNKKVNNDDNYGFENKCYEWAEKVEQRFIDMVSDSVIAVSHEKLSLRDAGGLPFSDWISKNWKKPEMKATIIRIFSTFGLSITQRPNKYKDINYVFKV